MGSYVDFITCEYCGYEYAIARREGSMYSSFQCSMCGAAEHDASDDIWQEMQRVAEKEAKNKGLEDETAFDDYVRERTQKLVNDYLEEEEGKQYKPTKQDIRKAKTKYELIYLVLSLYERPEGLFVEAGVNDTGTDGEFYRALIDGTFNNHEYDF